MVVHVQIGGPSMRTCEDRTLPFEVRAQVYGLLARLYLKPLDEQLMKAIGDPAFAAEWPLGRDLPDVAAGLHKMTSAMPKATVESLRQEFWSLFGTLGPADAPPWQSAYLDRERVALGEETLRVRALFARFGLAFAEAGREPDDHIGLELAFLANLSTRVAEGLAAGDQAGVRTLLEGQRECLEEHLVRWVEPFVNRVEAASESGFYAGLARLTLGLLRSELVEVRQWLAGPSLS